MVALNCRNQLLCAVEAGIKENDWESGFPPPAGGSIGMTETDVYSPNSPFSLTWLLQCGCLMQDSTTEYMKLNILLSAIFAAIPLRAAAATSPQSNLVVENGVIGWRPPASTATPSANQPPAAANQQPVLTNQFIRASPMMVAYRSDILVEWQTGRNPVFSLGDRIIMVQTNEPQDELETKTVVLRGGDTFFRAADPGVIQFYYVTPFDRILVSNPVTVLPFIPDLSTIRNATNAGTSIVIAGDSVALGNTNGVSLASLITPKTNLRVVNAGKAGDTSRSLLARYDTDVLAHSPKVVVLSIGGNDERPIAGAVISRAESLANIRAIIDKTHAKGASVLFLGIADFEPLLASQYRAIATEMRVAYIPDILEDLWLDPRYMRDALHPNARGYARIERRVGPAILALGGTPSGGPSVIPAPTGQKLVFTWTPTGSRVGINMSWNAAGGKWYRIVASRDIEEQPELWATVFRVKRDDSGPLSVTVRPGAAESILFYRLREE